MINTTLIHEAAARLAPVLEKTPLQYSKRLSEKYNARIYLKREDLTPVRSFKIRGAVNKMMTLTDEEKARGVVCASAGNHAQGVAYGCAKLKVHGVIFMPSISPMQKVEKVKTIGGSYVKVELTGNTFDDSFASAMAYCEKHTAVFIHPFNDELVMAGQGTVAKEIMEELNNKCDMVVSQIGGGGLISGVSSYIKAISPDTIIYGCEPQGAPSMYESMRAGELIGKDKIDTFIDGCAVKRCGDKTFAITRETVKEIFLVPEGKDCTTMIEMYQLDGIIAEPAGALSVATLDYIADKIKDKTVVCIVSGGNNDIMRYPEILERSLTYEGLKHYFIIEFAQKPGQLRLFLDKALGPTDDIVRFEYMKKSNKEKGPALVGIELKKRESFTKLCEQMTAIGLSYRHLEPSDSLYQYIV